jgi:hypothetical protein
MRRRRRRLRKKTRIRFQYTTKNNIKSLTTPLSIKAKRFFHTLKQTSRRLFCYEPINPQNFFLFFDNVIRFKFLLLLSKKQRSFANLSAFLVAKVDMWASSYFFYNRFRKMSFTNLFPNYNFYSIILKKFLRVLNRIRFATRFVPFYNNAIIRFLEFCSGKRVLIKYFTFLPQLLTLPERARCLS